MRKMWFLFISLFILAGCAKIEHLDQLLTLKAISDEQALMDKDVEAYNKKFKLLIEKVKSEDIKKYSNQKNILKNFGKPIYVSDATKNDQKLQVWMYRYAEKFMDSDKVFLYFDPAEKLVAWEFVEGKKDNKTAAVVPAK